MYHILNDEEYTDYRKLKEGMAAYLAVMKDKRYKLNESAISFEKDGCKEIADGIKNKIYIIDFAINELNKVI